MFKEICALVANDKLISVSVGSPGGVNFDFNSAWNEWKRKKFPYLIMIHSHPGDFLRMSSIDEIMVAGWAKAFPVPIFFIIVCKSDYDLEMYEEVAHESIVNLVVSQGKKVCISPQRPARENDTSFHPGLLHDIIYCSYEIEDEEEIKKYINNNFEFNSFSMSF